MEFIVRRARVGRVRRGEVGTEGEENSSRGNRYTDSLIFIPFLLPAALGLLPPHGLSLLEQYLGTSREATVLFSRTPGR